MFYYFLKFESLVFLDNAQDCNLGQCQVQLKPRKKICGPNQNLTDPDRGRNGFFQHLHSCCLKRRKNVSYQLIT